MTRVSAKRPSAISAFSYAKMIKAIIEGPATVEEICEESGYSKPTVRAYLKALKKERLIYVAEWQEGPNGRVNTPSYGWGDKRDVVRPVRSKNERMRRTRRRNRDAALLGIARAPGP